MPARKDVSIKMIAERCGVSIATVSRVVNGDANVSDAMRARVLAVMAECGYQPAAAPSSGVKSAPTS